MKAANDNTPHEADNIAFFTAMLGRTTDARDRALITARIHDEQYELRRKEGKR